MYKRFLSVITISIVCSSVLITYVAARTSFAYTSQSNPECPTISVDCPTELPEGGKTYTVSANIEGTVNKEKLTYHWSVAGETGEIVEGQGTASIKVYIKYTYQTTTATVEVCGLEDKCQKTASCSFTVAE